MHVYLLNSTNPDAERMIRMLRLPYTIVSCDVWALTSSLRRIVIMGNGVPSMQLFKSVYERPDLPVMSPVVMCIRDQKLVYDGCLYIPNGDYNSSERMAAEGECDEKYTSDTCEFSLPERASVELVWSLVVRYWHDLSPTFTKEVLIPLWIHETQLRALRSRHPIDYHHVASQSIFAKPYKYEIRDGTMKDALAAFNSLTSLGPNGVKYRVRERVGKHPFILPGIVMVEEIDVHVDSRTTVIGHYYALNLPGKSEDVYHKSLREWIQLLHPIVFYGDKSTCDLVMKLRCERKLGEYTRVVPGKHTDHKVWRNDSIYESVTLMKPYLVMDAIKRNDYMSERYAYMDPGIYKHDAFASGEFTGGRLFENVQVANDIRIQSMLGAAISDSTSEEYLLCGVMIGSITAWTRFMEKYEPMVDRLEVYTAEQKVITRIATLYPELFEMVLGGLHSDHYRVYFVL